MARCCKIYEPIVDECGNNNSSYNYDQINIENSKVAMTEKDKIVFKGCGLQRSKIFVSSNEPEMKKIIVTIEVPCWLKLKNGQITQDKFKIEVNKNLADNIQQIFKEIYDLTPKKFYFTQAPHAYKWRCAQRNDGNCNSNPPKPSNHCYGVSLDINQDVNPNNKGNKGTDKDTQTCIRTSKHPVVKIFKKYGWGWCPEATGYKYNDYMHFSFYGGH